MSDRWKRFKKSLVIRDDGGHLGLLEHDLRDPDGIRIVGAPPGKITPLLPVPAKETLRNISFHERYFIMI